VIAVGPVRLPNTWTAPRSRRGRRGTRSGCTRRSGGRLLQEDVSRVLVENLSALLAGKRVAVVRWSS